MNVAISDTIGFADLFRFFVTEDKTPNLVDYFKILAEVCSILKAILFVDCATKGEYDSTCLCSYIFMTFSISQMI